MKQLRNHLPESWSLVFSAFASAYGIGLLSLLALPFLISAAITDLALNEAAAGYLLSAEFAFTMIASLIVAPIMGTAPRKTLAIIGGLIAIAANVISATVTDVYTLAIIRCIAGAGAGLCLACGNACVSSAKDPDRVAGYMNVIFVALMIIVMIVFASTMASYGLSGLYYAMAITMSVMLLLVLMMPQQVDTSDHAYHHHPDDMKLFSAGAIFMIVAMLLFSARDTMGWAFVEQVGINVGYDGETLGLLFSLQAFIGLLGPLAAAIIGKRFGISVPVILGVIICGSATLGYVMGEASKTMYTVAVLMNAAAYFYALAYLTALAASLDKEGRIVAAAGSFLTLGVAVGPALSGTLIAAGGYELTAIAIAITTLLTAVCLFVPIAKAKERNEHIKASMAAEATVLAS